MAKHSHHIREKSRGKKFVFIVVINFSVAFLEVIAGVLSGSLLLISDAFHNFQDTISLIISYIGWFYSLKTPTVSNTYGYKRAEIIAAFVNSVFLTLISVFIMFEGLKRYFTRPIIDTDIMFLSSLLAFLVNLISAYLLHRDALKSLNWRTAYLHMLADAMFSFSVLVGSVFIKRFSIYWVDPVLSFLMGIFILINSWKVLKKSLRILMQSSPDIDYTSIKNDIESINGVKNIHHVHCWMNNEDEIYFEAHIEVDSNFLVEQTSRISAQINKILKDKYSIKHTTLQFEADVCREKVMFDRSCLNIAR